MTPEARFSARVKAGLANCAIERIENRVNLAKGEHPIRLMHSCETKGSHTAALCLLALLEQDAVSLFHLIEWVFGSVCWQGYPLIDLYHR